MTRARSLRSVARRVIGVIAVCGLLVAAVAVYELAPRLPRSPGVADAPPSAAGPTTAASPAPTASPMPSTPSTTPSPVPSGPAGPGTTEPGILITATPADQDTFTVLEQVRLGSPVDVVTLRPIALDRLGDDFADQSAEATEVEVLVDGQPQAVPGDEVTEPVEVTLSNPTDTITLRYRLGGTIVRTVPSTTGRALGAVAPLMADVPDDLPVVVYVTGRQVLNLYCPTRPLSQQACASGNVPRLRTKDTLPWKDSLVVAQLSLSMPR